jgi:capsid protein
LGDAVLLRQQVANLFVGSLTNASAADADVSPLTGLAPSTTQGGRAVVDLVPGILQELAPGEELKFSDPPDPPSSQSFSTEQARLACGAAGVPLQVVTGEWGATNDRLARVVLNQWRRRVERFRWSVVVPRLLRPTWATWAKLAGPRLLIGAEDCGATWRAHAWPYVHPVQDVAAQLQAVRGGLTSLSAVVAEASGEDAETVLRQIAEDNRLADELGLRLDSDSRQGGTK